MLPMALINILAAGIWHFMQPGIERWLVCALIVVGPYLALGRALFTHKHLSKRTYRYAE